jgi:hypothetical protein
VSTASAATASPDLTSTEITRSPASTIFVDENLG